MFNILIPDILMCIALELPDHDLYKFCSMNRLTYKLSNDEYLWKLKMDKRFPMKGNKRIHDDGSYIAPSGMVFDSTRYDISINFNNKEEYITMHKNT